LHGTAAGPSRRRETLPRETVPRRVRRPGCGRRPGLWTTLGWGVSRFALDIPWRPVLHENLAATVATSVLIMVIGVAASADVLKRKPLAALRAE